MIFSCISSFIIAFLVTYFITPLIINIAIQMGVVDKPGGRRINTKIIPRWGGIAIYLGILTALLFSSFVFGPIKTILNSDNFLIKKYLFGIIFSSTIIVYIGLRDDKIGISATEKLFGQIIASQIIMQYGIKIAGFSNPFFNAFYNFSIIFSVFITILWILIFVNSINFIDGLDGLAIGIVIITLLAFLIITFKQINNVTQQEMIQKHKFIIYLIIIILGSCLAFLKYNFHPAKIFMGDSGSMLLGFLIGVITIIGILKSIATITIIIPIFILGIPFLDITAAVIRRWRKNIPISTPDRKHFHHRLLDMGLSHKSAVLVAYLFTLILALISILISFKKGI